MITMTSETGPTLQLSNMLAGEHLNRARGDRLLAHFPGGAGQHRGIANGAGAIVAG
jgi:hypothetical protein